MIRINLNRVFLLITMKKILYFAVLFSLAFDLYSFTYRSWNKVDFVKDASRNEIYFNLNSRNQPLLANVLFYKAPKEQHTDLEIYTFTEEDKSFVLWKTFPEIDKKLGLNDYTIKRIETNAEGKVWLLFSYRQLIYEDQKGELQKYAPPRKYDTLVSEVSSFFIDFEGGIWLKVSSGKYLSDGTTKIFDEHIIDWYKLNPYNSELQQLSHFYTPNEAQGFQTIGRLIQNPYTHEIYGINDWGMFDNGYLENALYKLNSNGEIIQTYPLKRHTVQTKLTNPHRAYISSVEFTSDGKKIIYALEKNSSGGGIPGGISIYDVEEKNWYILENDPAYNYLEVEKDYGSRYVYARYFEGKLWIFHFWGWIMVYDGNQIIVLKTSDVMQKNYISEIPAMYASFTQNENTIWLETGAWDVIRLEASASKVEDAKSLLGRIYPVPAKAGEPILIEFPNKDVTFNRLIDLNGREIKVQTIDDKDKLVLSTSGLGKGVYFIELSYNKHTFGIKIILE